jgi:dipeptidyl aminopeptidase/acylaminoacyl peptidase
MDGYRYSPEKQALAAAGYFVVFSNPRGSTGYPESWARAVRGKQAAVDPGLGFGEPVLADLLAVVEQAVTEFGIDSERVGITGTSYGGFMTAWALGASERFRAGVCINPSINLATIIWRGDGFVVPWLSGQLGVDVLADSSEVIRNSAISVASGISAPLLLLHAENDKGCPIEQSEQLFIRLRHWGRVVRMIRFPNSSHVIASPYQLKERLRFTLEWFDHYVRAPESQPDSTSSASMPAAVTSSAPRGSA